MGIGSIGSTYFNFILGTGSEDVGKMLKHRIKNRKAHGESYGRALYDGTKRGIKFSHAKQMKAGGFWKNLGKSFCAFPAEIKKGKGFFGKIKGGIKGVGKTMPALFAFLTLAGEIPNAYKATKEKGIGQGVKEIGKTAVRLTTGALFGAIGSAILPVGGSIVGWMVGDWIGSKLVGRSYSEKAEDKIEQKPSEQTNPTQTTTITTGGVVGGPGYTGYVQFPSIDENDFGPHRPYANIFFNNPAAYADFGARMPDQANVMYGTYGYFPPMGFGVQTNESPNLLNNKYPGGNLLNPTGKQNAYYQENKVQQGTKLNIEK